VADWRVALLKARGYPTTKSNMNLLTAWQRMEGGGTHNDASFNPLNTTRNAPGAVRSINSVGVKAFDTFEHGIGATADTLDNYETISRYLAAGKGSDALRDPAGQGDFNMWVSGKDTPGASPYVSKIAGALGVDTGNASVKLGGQSYGGGQSPKAAQQKVADNIGAQRQMTAGFLMQAAQQSVAGNPQLGGGSLLSLAQARDALQKQAVFEQADLGANLKERGVDVQTADGKVSTTIQQTAKQFGLNVTSGYRSVAKQTALYAGRSSSGSVAAPGKSWHNTGRAYDVAPDDKALAFLDYAFKNPSLFKEVFYDPAGKSIKNGKIVNYTIGGHSDHVHFAQ